MSLHQLSIGTGMHHQLPGEGERKGRQRYERPVYTVSAGSSSR